MNKKTIQIHNFYTHEDFYKSSFFCVSCSQISEHDFLPMATCGGGGGPMVKLCKTCGNTVHERIIRAQPELKSNSSGLLIWLIVISFSIGAASSFILFTN